MPAKPSAPSAPLLFVAVAAALLTALAFDEIALHPRDYVLYADYDGGKNYFTPYSYVEGVGTGPAHAHPLKVYGQHYPFGEYVFYTDNTPLVSIGARVLARLGLIGGNGGVALLSYFFLFSHWLAAVLLYLLLRRAGVVTWMAVVLGACLPWGAKQYWHLNMGSPNLGNLAATFGLLWLLWDVYERPERWRPWLSAGVLIGLAAWLHLYYLLVYGFALALMAVGLVAGEWVLRGRLTRAVTGRRALRAAGAGALAIALIYVPVLLIDDKLALRTGTALAYGLDAWRIDPRTLVTPWPEYRSTFFVTYPERVFGERSGYMGLWFWYGLTALALAWGTGVARVGEAFGPRGRRFPLALFAIGVFCFAASLGTSYRAPDGALEWDIVLNPFAPFVNDLVMIQQFRAIARFFFVTQWAWALPVAIGLSGLWLRRACLPVSPGLARPARLAVTAAVPIVVALAALDAKDLIGARRKLAYANPTGTLAAAPYRAFADAHDLSGYAGLLIAPYFHVGAQVTGLVADPQWEVERQTWSLVAGLGLPTINAVTSRTPPHEARALMAFVREGTRSDSLRAAGLAGRPLLVAVHREHAARVREGDFSQWPRPNGEPAVATVIASAALPERTGVRPLGTVGAFDFYRYDYAP